MAPTAHWSSDVIDAGEAAGLCRRVLDHCAALTGTWPLPRYKLDPVDMPPDLLPALSLMDVLPDGEFRVRLFGTGLRERYGQELTGKYLRDCETGEPVEESYRIYQDIVRTRRPGIRRITFPTALGPICYDRLLIPLSAEDGQVRYILMAIQIVDGPAYRTVLEAAGKEPGGSDPR